MKSESAPSTIDDYIRASDPSVQEILQSIRKIIRTIAPDAEEHISYKMPAFKQQRIFIYFAAFKNHIGIYPPITDDKALIAKLASYRNEKGNLSFPLKQAIPYDLIEQVAKSLFKQYAK